MKGKMTQQAIEQRFKVWQKEYVGLPPRVQKRIDRLVNEYEKTRKIMSVQDRTLNLTSGVRLIREFKGEKYEVTTLERGFKYQGKTYKSLSAIANEITGTRWNGKVFFGVAK